MRGCRTLAPNPAPGAIVDEPNFCRPLPGQRKRTPRAAGAWHPIVKKSYFVIGHKVGRESRRHDAQLNRRPWRLWMTTTAVVYTTGFACASNLTRTGAGCIWLRAFFAPQAQEQESQMMKAATARQRAFTPERDEARCELVRGLPPRLDWRSEARRALASDRLTIDGNGRIIRTRGAPTGFMLDPLISGRQVYIRDECGTRYWLGSPNRLRAVLRWLLS